MMLINRRRAAQSGSPAPNYLMTATSNPEVFPICVEQGWCSAEGMTYEEAAAVTSIPSNLFENKGLIHFREFKYFSVTDLVYTFNRNTTLQFIELPNTLTRISNSTFAQCNLAYLDVPENVATISTSAFNNGNRSMQYIIIRRTTPPSIQTSGSYKILDGTNNCPVYVPDASVNAYKTAWSDVASRIYPLSEFVEPT
jgi:hypothetical protein